MLFAEFGNASQILMPNYTPCAWHECDIWRVTKSGYAQEYEIKLTVADFRADQRKGHKMDALAAHSTLGPTRFWYVTPEGLLENECLPLWAGLIEASPGRYGKPLVSKGSSMRHGPRLHNKKAAPWEIVHAQGVCYWRMWAERLQS